jgi:hypothetical protein
MDAVMKFVRPPLGRAVAIYVISVPVAWAIAPQGGGWEFVAAALTLMLVPIARLGPWWLVINAVFLPALVAVLQLELPAAWALMPLCVLLLLYGTIWRSQVPLFFSSRDTQAALASLLPTRRAISFLDVGCGDGRVLAGLAATRPESCFEGIEHALVPWLAARLRCITRHKQCKVHRGNLWRRTLTPYDVVYAFLSPAVMERLWHKAQHEMRPGTLLVSAYGVPDVLAHERVDVGDALQTRLHVWRMGVEGQAHDSAG